MTASSEWFERYKNAADRPSVRVWRPTSMPSARLQTVTLGYGDDAHEALPKGDLNAYLTIAGIDIGGQLDDLELMLAAATEELRLTREYATSLQADQDAS